MRLFLAVRPSTSAAEHLDLALTLAADPSASTLRWTAPENRHLTVAFYGEVPDGAVPELQEALQEQVATLAEFDLRLHGAGVFSGRTLWIGAAGDVAAMASLARVGSRVGEEVLGRSDPRPRHRAHLTVARVPSARTARPRRGGRPAARGVDDVGGLVRALAGYDGPTWTVDEVVLVESHPGEGRSGGPRYDDVARLRLADDAAGAHDRTAGPFGAPH